MTRPAAPPKAMRPAALADRQIPEAADISEPAHTSGDLGAIDDEIDSSCGIHGKHIADRVPVDGCCAGSQVEPWALAFLARGAYVVEEGEVRDDEPLGFAWWPSATRVCAEQ